MLDKPMTRAVNSMSKSEGKALAEIRSRNMLIWRLMSPASFVNHALTLDTYYTYTVITFYEADEFSRFPVSCSTFITSSSQN